MRGNNVTYWMWIDVCTTSLLCSPKKKKKHNFSRRSHIITTSEFSSNLGEKMGGSDIGFSYNAMHTRLVALPGGYS